MLKLYHGSFSEVRIPNLNLSRLSIDFGRSFYLTTDEMMAKKWACNKYSSVLNEYILDEKGLLVKRFVPNEEWLKYVVHHRIGEAASFDDSVFDVIVGPTVDDKIFSVIDLYTAGLISEVNTVELINCMDCNNQVVLKTQKAVDSLHFEKSISINAQEQNFYRDKFKTDAFLASKRIHELLRKMNGR